MRGELQALLGIQRFEQLGSLLELRRSRCRNDCDFRDCYWLLLQRASIKRGCNAYYVVLHCSALTRVEAEALIWAGDRQGPRSPKRVSAGCAGRTGSKLIRNKLANHEVGNDKGPFGFRACGRSSDL
jgi:hypothetical protein